MRLSQSGRLALATVAAASLWGCGSGNQAADGGNDGVGGGMPPGDVQPGDLLSDFDEGQAVILPLGSPARNGYWYAYNDASVGCLQSPAHGDRYYASAPAAPPPGPSGGRALHADWNQCSTWGAGVGADFNAPITDGGITTGAAADAIRPAVVHGRGLLGDGLARHRPSVRLKMVMRASTQIQDGGTCDESVLGPDRCGDEWGEPFMLPTDGTWKAVTVRFSDATFKPEGWGSRSPGIRRTCSGSSFNRRSRARRGFTTSGSTTSISYVRRFAMGRTAAVMLAAATAVLGACEARQPGSGRRRRSAAPAVRAVPICLSWPRGRDAERLRGPRGRHDRAGRVAAAERHLVHVQRRQRDVPAGAQRR